MTGFFALGNTVLFAYLLAACQETDIMNDGSKVTTLRTSKDAFLTKSWSFKVAPEEISDGGVIEPGKGVFTRKVRMRHDMLDSSHKFTQVDRTHTQNIVQIRGTGTKKTAIIDVPYLPSSRKLHGRSLDILLVLDTSGSMLDVQGTLGTKFNNLIKEVEGGDWRIAVTTTDIKRCLNSNWIFKKDDTDASARFQGITKDTKSYKGNISTIYRPRTHETDNERPLLMAINALGGNYGNHDNKCRGRKGVGKINDWFRKADTNSLMVVFVTDEQDHLLRQQQQKGDKKTVRDALIEHIEKTMGYKNEHYKLFGIMDDDLGLSCKKIFSSNFFKEHGGERFCDVKHQKNYDTVISKLATGAYNILSQSLDLSHLFNFLKAAKKTNIKILKLKSVINNKQLKTLNEGTDYTYDSSKQVIDFKASVPAIATIKVQISYDYVELPEPRKSFNLLYTPVTNSLRVNKNCGSWNAKHSLKAKSITFTNAPPFGCTFDLVYKKQHITLKKGTSLHAAAGYTINRGEVKVSGGHSFSVSTGGWLAFTGALPSDGEVVNITYKQRKERLSYPYRRRAGSNLTCKPRCSYANGKITISKNDFVYGKDIVVTEKTSKPVTSFVLQEEFYPETLSVDVEFSDGSSETCNSLHIEESRVMIASTKAKEKCAALKESNIKQIVLNPYEVKANNVFVIDEDSFFIENGHKSETFKVYLDGESLDSSAYKFSAKPRTFAIKNPPESYELRIDMSLIF